MQRSMLAVHSVRRAALARAASLGIALALGIGLVACAESRSSANVTAPVASAAPVVVASAPVPASVDPATPAPSATAAAPSSAPAHSAGAAPGAGPMGADLAGADPKFRGCHADADCAAVPRAGCCHNGWLEGVAVTQKDAYAKANACTMSTRPICPMYIVHDARVPKCEAQSHLCVLVQP
jgi:hypothetical protein